MGAEGSMDKLMEADGPIVRDISRNVERSLSVLGNQTKYNIIQWMDVRRIIQYVGIDGVTKETLDFDPLSLVPSHMDGESRDNPSAFTKIKRARAFADSLRFFITPHSAHEITQMSYRLGLIQLRKAGIQIDSRTIAESWDLNNFGNEPAGNTILERYWNEQDMIAVHAVKMKQLIDAVAQSGVSPTPAMAGAAGEGATPFVPPQEGRPPSGQQAPQLVSKDGGARSTISESGS
jgi:hypothetical protein